MVAVRKTGAGLMTLNPCDILEMSVGFRKFVFLVKSLNIVELIV